MNNITIAEDQQDQLMAVDFNSLMARAIDTKIDVNSLERMLAMWEKIQAKKAEKSYFDALRCFQAACPVITKTKEVCDKNGSIRYSYAPIESVVDQVKKLLDENGFSYTIAPEQSEGKFTAIIKSHHTGGHCEITRFEVPIDSKMYASEPQKVAAARTLAVRYAFLNAYGIVTADQDVDGAETKNEPAEKKQKPREKKNEVISGTINRKNMWEHINTIADPAIKVEIGSGIRNAKTEEDFRHWINRLESVLNPPKEDLDKIADKGFDQPETIEQDIF